MLIFYNNIINNNNISLFVEIIKLIYYKLKSFSAIIKNKTYNKQNISLIHSAISVDDIFINIRMRTTHDIWIFIMFWIKANRIFIRDRLRKNKLRKKEKEILKNKERYLKD